MKIFNKVIIIILSLLLSACFGSPSSVPEDRFYTLRVKSAERVKTRYKLITIKKVHAYGLYNERAMLYAKSDFPLQIKRYHYHHWVMPPTQLIQQNLKDYLSNSHIAENVVVRAISSVDTLRISAELLAFERVMSVDKQAVHIELAFEVKQPNGKYHSYKYKQDVTTSSNTLHAAADAFGIALGHIFKKLLSELES